MLRNHEILSQAYIVQRRLAVEEFKLCPLCRAVNLLENENCFCCNWEGRFDHDPDHIESALYEMVYRCPELLAILIEDEPNVRPGFFERVWSFFSRLRRRVDVRA
jgi:hypothetical protein